MVLNNKPRELGVMTRIDTEGGRFYKTPDGVFPSVTTVLSSMPNPGLDAWKLAVGEDEAMRVSKLATTKGTKMHSFCEAYLKGESPQISLIDRDRYQGLTTHLDLIDPIAIEQQMWSTKLRVAGTADCVGKYKGRLCLIDFKTTSSLKHAEEIESYWMQTSAYAVMAFERMNLIIPNLLIVMQDLTAGECYVYEEKTENWVAKFKAVRNAFKD